MVAGAILLNVLLCLFLAAVSAGAHVPQVQGDHRTQIYRHHLQVRSRPLPDRPGEEGVYGMRMLTALASVTCRGCEKLVSGLLHLQGPLKKDALKKTLEPLTEEA